MDIRFPLRSLKLLLFGILLVVFGAVAPRIFVDLITGSAVGGSSPILFANISAAYFSLLLQTTFVLLGFVLGIIGVFVRD